MNSDNKCLTSIFHSHDWLRKTIQDATHRLLIGSCGNSGRPFTPCPPSWSGDGSMRWNINGVRFCVRYEHGLQLGSDRLMGYGVTHTSHRAFHRWGGVPDSRGPQEGIMGNWVLLCPLQPEWSPPLGLCCLGSCRWLKAFPSNPPEDMFGCNNLGMLQ